MSRIFVSSSVERRVGEALRWLSSRGDGSGLRIVAPTQSAAEDLARRLGSTLGVETTTLARWPREIAALALARSQRSPVSQLAAEALAARVATQLQGEQSLEHFGPVADRPGFATSLSRTLRELRLADLSAADLLAGPRAAADLGRLLEAYSQALDEWSLADRASILRLAADAAAGACGGESLLWLDLPLRHELEARFLAGASEGAEVLATCPRGDEETLARLERILGVATRVDEEVEPTESNPLVRAQRQVFVSQAEAPSSAPVSDDSVVLFSAAGEGQECVEIARRIRDLAAEGTSFEDVAVLLRNPAAYQPLVEDALRRAKIPVYFSKGTVRPDVAGRAFLALLRCATEDFSASRFAEYLSLAQVPTLDAEGGPAEREVPWVEPQDDQLVLFSVLPVEGDDVPSEPAEPPPSERQVAGSLRVPHHWERLLVDAAVIGGKERWRRRLDGLGRELEMRLREVDAEDEHLHLGLERALRRLDNLKRFALPVIDQLAELPEAATWGMWIAALETLASRTLLRPESVLQLLAELRPMSDVGPVDLQHVRRVLADRLRFLRSTPPRRRGGRVLVSGIEEAAGRSYSVVFLPGLAEGIFPRRLSEDPLLLESLRAELGEPGQRLPSLLERGERERLLLHLAVGAARDRLVASYPRVDLALGRARVPSLYALDLVRAARGRLPDLEELSRAAAGEAEAVIGWPAPEVCDHAIDDAEFDLALLQPFLSGLGTTRAANRTGQARFLLSCNEHLGRSLRARGRRWRRRWFPADGLVEPHPATLEVLAAHAVGRRSYSPTALQHFAACPYRFFLQAIHRLRPLELSHPLEQLDPLTRGRMFHEIQFRLFHELRGRELLPVTDENLNEVLGVVDDEVRAAAERYEEELAPAIPRVWAEEIEGIRSDLKGWLRQVLHDDGFVPFRFELAFGLPPSDDHDAQSQPEPVSVLDGLALRGAIDLVEVHPRTRQIRVTDHKTGRALRADRRLVIGGGKVLQPVLYALAAEKLLAGVEPEPGEALAQIAADAKVASGRLFYCTQRGDYREIVVENGHEARQSASELVATLRAHLESGFLPAAPDEGQCRFCDYRVVCGPYEQQRARAKNPGPLEQLTQLRARP